MTLCPQPFNKLEITGIPSHSKSFARRPLTISYKQLDAGMDLVDSEVEEDAGV